MVLYHRLNNIQKYQSSILLFISARLIVFCPLGEKERMWENYFIGLTSETVTYNAIDFIAFYKHRILCAKSYLLHQFSFPHSLLLLINDWTSQWRWLVQLSALDGKLLNQSFPTCFRLPFPYYSLACKPFFCVQLEQAVPWMPVAKPGFFH